MIILLATLKGDLSMPSVTQLKIKDGLDVQWDQINKNLRAEVQYTVSQKYLAKVIEELKTQVLPVLKWILVVEYS